MRHLLPILLLLSSLDALSQGTVRRVPTLTRLLTINPYASATADGLVFEVDAPSTNATWGGPRFLTWTPTAALAANGTNVWTCAFGGQWVSLDSYAAIQDARWYGSTNVWSLDHLGNLVIGGTNIISALSGMITDTPPDTILYGRKNTGSGGAWTAVSAGTNALSANATAVLLNSSAYYPLVNLLDTPTVAWTSSGGAVYATVPDSSITQSKLSTSAKANLLSRANHTGSQSWSTISDGGDGVWEKLKTAVLNGAGLDLVTSEASQSLTLSLGSHAHAASDITSGTLATARLGSGTASSLKYLAGNSTWATLDTNAIPGLNSTIAALASQTHDASVIVSGYMSPARLGIGTPSTNSFLRGDGSWATISTNGSSSSTAGTNSMWVTGNFVTNLTTGANVSWAISGIQASPYIPSGASLTNAALVTPSLSSATSSGTLAHTGSITVNTTNVMSRIDAVEDEILRVLPGTAMLASTNAGTSVTLRVDTGLIPTLAANNTFAGHNTFSSSNTFSGGIHAGAAGSSSEAFGFGASAANGSTSVGGSASAGGIASVAAGQSASASGDGSISIGWASAVSGANSVALGPNVVETRDWTIELGSASHTVDVPGALVAANITLGGVTRTDWPSSGDVYTSSNNVFTAVNTFTNNLLSPSSGADSLKFGSATASGERSMAFGISEYWGSTIASGYETIAMGVNARARQGPFLGGAVAIGSNSSAEEGAAALGAAAVAAGYFSVAGPGATATGQSTVAFGAFASATHDYSAAIGREAATTATNQIRLGRSSATVSIPGTLIPQSITLGGVNRTTWPSSGSSTNIFNAGTLVNGTAVTNIVDGANVSFTISGLTASVAVPSGVTIDSPTLSGNSTASGSFTAGSTITAANLGADAFAGNNYHFILRNDSDYQLKQADTNFALSYLGGVGPNHGHSTLTNLTVNGDLSVTTNLFVGGSNILALINAGSSVVLPASRLAGRGSAGGTGALQAIGLGGSLSMSGTNLIIAAGNWGDVTTLDDGVTWAINTNVVTFAKMQTISAGKVMGRTSVSTGAPQEITLDAPLSMSGTHLQVADGSIALAKLTHSTIPSVLVGRGSGAAGPMQQIGVGAGLAMVGTNLTATAAVSIRPVAFKTGGFTAGNSDEVFICDFTGDADIVLPTNGSVSDGHVFTVFRVGGGSLTVKDSDGATIDTLVTVGASRTWIYYASGQHYYLIASIPGT